MSDQTNDEMLDQNIARLLSGNSDQPVLSEAAESRMLETLHTKQAKLVSKKEKPMDHAVVPAERKSLIVPVTAVAIVACLIIFAMFFAPFSGAQRPRHQESHVDADCRGDSANHDGALFLYDAATPKLLKVGRKLRNQYGYVAGGLAPLSEIRNES